MKLSWSEWLGHFVTGWRNYRYPATPTLPPKPWHPDGDEAFTTPPTTLHPNSARIIAHLKRTGGVSINTGPTRPNQLGIVWGYPLNEAMPTDRRYLISDKPGQGRLHVQTHWASSYGAEVRYHPRMMVAGNPANNVLEADAKLHIYDDVDLDEGPTITEIQNFRDLGNGLLSCDGVTKYSLSLDSHDARGRSAAHLPLAEQTLRYDDLMAGWRQRATMGLAAGRKDEFVHPARATDAKSVAPDAPPFGLVLRLRPDVLERFAAQGITAKTHPQSWAVMECYSKFGLIMVDTGGNNSSQLQPDNRWNQTDLSVVRRLTADDFECWVA